MAMQFDDCGTGPARPCMFMSSVESICYDQDLRYAPTDLRQCLSSIAFHSPSVEGLLEVQIARGSVKVTPHVMSELNVPDPEELMMCPYDKVHMVRAKRFQYHLMKCRKNWPGSEFAVCPFNAKHEMPRPELRYHMATCSNRAVLERDIAFDNTRTNVEGVLFKGCTDVPAYSTKASTDECWDVEMNSCPRIGVDATFFEKFKYIDTSRYTTEENGNICDNMKAVFEGQVVKKVNAGKNPSGKLRLPQNESHASKLTQPAQPVQHPSNVFAYSLSMAGIGRGKSKGIEVSEPTVGQRGILNMGLGRGMPEIGLRDLMTRPLPDPQFIVPTVISATPSSLARDGVLQTTEDVVLQPLEDVLQRLEDAVLQRPEDVLQQLEDVVLHRPEDVVLQQTEDVLQSPEGRGTTF